MANRLLTQGQKRKRIIQMCCTLIAVVAILMGVSVHDSQFKQAQSLLLYHQTAQGTITDLYQDVEHYRGRNGKTKTRDVYFLRYDFTVAEQLYFGEIALTPEQYTEIAGQQHIEIWYQAAQPSVNMAPFKLNEQLTSQSTVRRALRLAMFIIPASVLLYYLLAFLFAREPKGYLPEGFYSDNSWLDVEDGFLVVLNEQCLSALSIHKKHLDEVQHLYQNQGSWEQILATAHGKLKEIPYADITCIRSDHSSDVITVEYGVEQVAKIEFLNPTVKAHALVRLQRYLPQRLILNTHHFSRFRSVRNSLIVIAVLSLLLAWVSELWLSVVIATILLIMIKHTISRWLDPTVRSLWIDLKSNRQVAN
ncbi:hypothetical protein [Motilimonas sp. KMU-193]|uniref:hypothetical protein n=1 Tax=Motilimonas sp. KMU-193 TaxID=3388668 RepID=UPI00396AFAEF